MGLVFKDALFDAQWLRAAAHAGAGGAEIGECLAAARLVREPDPESWFSAWFSLAERVAAEAEKSLSGGHRASARAAFLRASNYFRTAYIFLFGAPVAARLVDAYGRHRKAFEAAVALMDYPAEPIAIPYGDGHLHGYLFRPAAEAGRCRPTLVISTGYDSTAEESYLFSGAAAVARGYVCIAFDGPGQGAALIEDGLVFRPDWEAVVSPVIDFAEACPEVDPARIALMGVSFGGCLAPRAASREARLAALILDPGQFSLFEEMKSRLPRFVARQLPDGNPLMLAFLRRILSRRLRSPTGGWALRRGMWVHGVGSPLDYLRLTAEYGVGDDARRIRCPTLVCAAENDEIGVTARRLHDALTCEAAFMAFTAGDGTGEHCEVGARSVFNERAFDWLDAVLAR